MVVTVYSKPACMQCRMTKRYLDAANVPYVEKDVTTDPEAAQAVRDLGYKALPVTTVALADGLDHWTGFVPMSLAALAELSN